MSDGLCITDHRFGVPPEIDSYEPALMPGERYCMQQIRQRIERLLETRVTFVPLNRTEALLLARALRRGEQEALG